MWEKRETPEIKWNHKGREWNIVQWLKTLPETTWQWRGQMFTDVMLSKSQNLQLYVGYVVKVVFLKIYVHVEHKI